MSAPAIVVDERPNTSTPGMTVVEVWCPHRCGVVSQRPSRTGARVIRGGFHIHGAYVGEPIGSRVADCGGDQYLVMRGDEL